MTDSNTVPKQSKPKRPVPPQLKPFRKGKGADIDPRINTKGRPKSFDQLRALFQDIAVEEVTLNGKKYTRAQAIGLAMSSDKKFMRDFLEYAYGKVPQPVTGTGEDGVIEHVVTVLSDEEKLARLVVLAKKANES